MNDTVPPGGTPTDEERARAVREQLKSVHAFDLAYEMMVGLVSFGYQKMGLTDETRPIRDLDDARLSIELLRATLGVLEREQGPERVRELYDTLAQMQLSYARATQLSGSGKDAETVADAEPEASPEPTEAPEEPAPPKERSAKKKPAAKKKPSQKPAEPAPEEQPAEDA